jgi:hypothetical protein
MACVVDSQEWLFDGWTNEEVISAFEDILDRFDRAFARKEVVWIGDDLQTKLVFSDLDLWTLRSADSPIQIPDDIWQEMSAALGKAQRYLDELTWPDGFDSFLISIDGNAATENPDVAWAHHKVRGGQAVACLGLKRKGRFATESVKDIANVHWTHDERSCSVFWREAIDVERDSPETLRRLAPMAYPGLYFTDDVWAGLGRFSGGYYANSTELRRYLAILNDDGTWAFTAPPPAQVRSEAQGVSTQSPTAQLVIQRFIRLQLDVTPENPDVYRNRDCREAREVQVLGDVLYFGWHGKLQAHQNRIHIHAPTPTSNGRVLVGIFHEHLPLPT